MVGSKTVTPADVRTPFTSARSVVLPPSNKADTVMDSPEPEIVMRLPMLSSDHIVESWSPKYPALSL